MILLSQDKLNKVLSCALTLLFFITFSCAKKEPEKKIKTVMVDAYLIENPGEKKTKNVQNGKVKRGEYVVINEEKDFNGKKYFNVTIEGVSTTGWLDSANARDGKLESVTVIKDDDLYTRPNIKSDKTGTVKAGQVAFKLEEKDQFVLIQYPGKEAYILKTSLGKASMIVKSIAISGLGKATITASSQYIPTEGKESQFDPRNAFDNKLQTAWCEGKNGDDGIGEYIYLTFENSVMITKVSIVNGYAVSNEAYKNNNRVATLKIVSEDSGKEVIIELADDNFDYQSQDIMLKGTSFKFVIDKVYKGKVSDTCISEIKLTGKADITSRVYEDDGE